MRKLIICEMNVKDALSSWFVFWFLVGVFCVWFGVFCCCFCGGFVGFFCVYVVFCFVFWLVAFFSFLLAHKRNRPSVMPLCLPYNLTKF